MLCGAFVTFVVTVGGIGVLAWLALRRIAAHLKENPDGIRPVIDHIVRPLLEKRPVEKEPPVEVEAKPQVKKIEGRLV